MKKRNLVIAILLVLSLSFVFLGCPDGDGDKTEEPTPEVKDPTVPQTILTALQSFGFSGTLPVPTEGNYKTSAQPILEMEEDGDEYTKGAFYVVWDKCTADMMPGYKTLWGNRAQIQLARDVVADESFTLKNIGTGISGTVYFTVLGGPQNGVDIPANSIVFFAQKSQWTAKP